MSTPRNHHYVSQVLSRKFLDGNGKIYLYDKAKNVFTTVASTKLLFSQKDLNSALTEDGNIEHSSVETNLNRHFETDFNKHYDRIINAATSHVSVGHQFTNSEELTESLEYMIRMGIIGQMRTPYGMKETEAAIFGALFTIAELATDELKASIYGHYNTLSGVTNKTPVDFKEASDRMLNLMGDKVYSLHRAPEGSFFLLPDCSAVTARAQIEDDTVIDGKIYYNLQRPIASVTMPINSQMFIGTNAKKIMPGMGNGFYALDAEGVKIMNHLFYEAAYEQVACADKAYLKKFVQDYLQEQTNKKAKKYE